MAKAKKACRIRLQQLHRTQKEPDRLESEAIRLSQICASALREPTGPGTSSMTSTTTAAASAEAPATRSPKAAGAAELGRGHPWRRHPRRRHLWRSSELLRSLIPLLALESLSLRCCPVLLLRRLIALVLEALSLRRCVSALSPRASRKGRSR